MCFYSDLDFPFIFGDKTGIDQQILKDPLDIQIIEETGWDLSYGIYMDILSL